MIYTGIGSRETPKYILDYMKNIGYELAQQGYLLRSGGADGADSAFEEGCNLAKGNKEIFIPWKNFNNSKSSLYNFPKEAFSIAKDFHPNWTACSEGAKKLHTRNVLQILGYNLNNKTNFVICWSKNDVRKQGGTGQALRIAKFYKVDIFNLNQFTQENNFSEVYEYLIDFIKRVESRKDVKEKILLN